MRAAVVVFVLAVLSLAASGALWSRAAAVPEPQPGRGATVLAAFASSHAPLVDVDLSRRYAGRLELLDPRTTLPTWHRHARDEAKRVHDAAGQCPLPAVPDAPALHDPALQKALEWQARTCAGALPPEPLLLRPPFMHPSGASYAALARAHGAPADWVRAHASAFHVLEIGGLPLDELGADERVLASLPSATWKEIAHTSVLVTADALVLVDHTPLGVGRLRVFARTDWESFARRAGVDLVARGARARCEEPASATLCWIARSNGERHATLFRAWTFGSGSLAVVCSIVVAGVAVRDRRRLHRDRIHVLRTLTHELRTPTTTMRLDVEPLKDAYDELPPQCQEPVLRLSESIERLHRVLNRNARYMELFESSPKTRARLVNLREVPSTRGMLEELAEEWPDGVTMRAPAEDGPFVTDPDWLGVALRNLVENAVRHGAPPVVVAWDWSPSTLDVRVVDGGATPRLKLRTAVAPHDRGVGSHGLGLGLALVDRAARLLGGRLSHEPSPTTFRLRIPRGAR